MNLALLMPEVHGSSSCSSAIMRRECPIRATSWPGSSLPVEAKQKEVLALGGYILWDGRGSLAGSNVEQGRDLQKQPGERKPPMSEHGRH